MSIFDKVLTISTVMSICLIICQTLDLCGKITNGKTKETFSALLLCVSAMSILASFVCICVACSFTTQEMLLSGIKCVIVAIIPIAVWALTSIIKSITISALINTNTIIPNTMMNGGKNNG